MFWDFELRYKPHTHTHRDNEAHARGTITYESVWIVKPEGKYYQRDWARFRKTTVSEHLHIIS